MSPTPCDHTGNTNTTYTSNNDGTHNLACSECDGNAVENEACDTDADGACSKCGYKAAVVVPTHEADTAKWGSNEAGHWNLCTVIDCAENHKYNEADHTYGDWNIDQAATSTAAGSRSRVCVICDYKQIETIPATGGGSSSSGSGSSGGGSGSSGGGGNSSANTNSNVTKNPDGSTTTTKVDQNTGAVTETTKNTDGSTVVTTTQKDGASTTVTTEANGVVATVAKDTTGKVEAEVKLPAAVVNAAGGKPVALPIEKMPTTNDLATASAVTIVSESAGMVKVAIPTVSATPGTVAVVVNPDGSTEVVKTSVATNDGVVVSLPSGSVVKVIDNSKAFADVASGDQSGDAVAFVSARGLFAGTSADTFSPAAPMTRAMIVTVLARYDGANTEGGNIWYENSMNWAVENGLSDGSNPSGMVSCEQLVMMIWRYVGSPVAAEDDQSNITGASDWATDAMNWAIGSGIVEGYGAGGLAPQGQVTRAEGAQIFQNLIVTQNA